LETRYQWNGICVEANPDSMAALLACRRVPCVNACVDGSAGIVAFQKNGLFGGIVAPSEETNAGSAGDVVRMKSIALLELLDTCRAPRVIDYLSIDVEGAEERVLAGVDYSKYTFRCMTIERPSQRLRAVLSGNDYQLVKDMPGLDACFVHRSFVEDYARNALAFWAGRS
ncbi:MAG: FkbM family methyltransferase, partial [Candidatus Methylopumilus sp.]